jgi:hypothetical protein
MERLGGQPRVEVRLPSVTAERTALCWTLPALDLRLSMAASDPFAHDGSCVSVRLAFASTGEVPAPGDDIVVNAQPAGTSGRVALSVGTVETTSGLVLAHASGSFFRTTAPLPEPTGPRPPCLQESGVPLDTALGLSSTWRDAVRTTRAQAGSLWQVRNPNDVLHGGVQMALVEVEARRTASAAWGADAVAHRVDIDHLKLCPADSELTLTTSVIFGGKNVIHTRTSLHDGRGDLVSVGAAVVLRELSGQARPAL